MTTLTAQGFEDKLSVKNPMNLVKNLTVLMWKKMMLLPAIILAQDFGDNSIVTSLTHLLMMKLNLRTASNQSP